jgi:hypothetical protein
VNQILVEARIAILGMEANKDNPAGDWLAYKHRYLQCLDELQDAGLSEQEAATRLRVLLS